MHDITVEKLMFSYDQELVLENINMEIEAGDFVCLLGQSGCGKSTLLRLLAGLSVPDDGAIYVKGAKINGTSLDRGVVFQDYSLFPWLTTGKNIMLSLRQKFKDESKKDLKDRTLYYFEKVGLDKSTFHKYPSELSGGMRQRSAICRSFALDPPILLMDEPFGALDEVTRSNLQNMVLDLWRKDKENRKTIIFVTHDVDEAILLATKIYVFGSKPGRIVYQHDFSKDKTNDIINLFEKPETIVLRKTLKDIIDQDINKKERY